MLNALENDTRDIHEADQYGQNKLFVCLGAVEERVERWNDNSRDHIPSTTTLLERKSCSSAVDSA